MKRIWIILLVVLVVTFAGCNKFGRGIAGSGNRKSEKRDVKSFNAIDTSGAYDVKIICQKPASLEIEADDNILPLIKTEVRNGVLFVTNDQEYHSAKSTALRISMPELNGVTNSGAGDVNIADVNTNELKIQSTGAASFDAAGKAKSVTISSTGAGSIDASKLTAEKARVDISGAARVEVYASDLLDVNVSGVGSVTYGGNPKTVTKSISGIGTVNPKS